MHKNFNLDKSLEILERTPDVYFNMLADLKHDWDMINEGPNTWNAHNIIGHLIHGELTDWIPRAKIILSEGEGRAFEPYDRFAQDKLYHHMSMLELLNKFKKLRIQNLEELKSWKLTATQLALTGIHPELGRVTLGELISTWTVHDLSHINQITRVMVRHYADDVGPWAQYIKILNQE